MMKMVLLASLFITTEVFAWGATGHRVVGQMASELLTPSAAQKIRHLLEGRSLARVSTWPDEIKSEPEIYKHTFNWHYTDWPTEMPEHDESSSAGKLMGSIAEQLKVLRDSKAQDKEKAFALKFLVHLVGDLHMPLHVGNGLDQGGNNCKLFFHGKQVNLHTLWDEAMLDFTRLSFTEIVDFLRHEVTSKELEAWKSGDLDDWARESKELRGTIYPQDVVTISEPLSVRQYCRKDIVLSELDLPKLGYEYSYKFLPLLEKRLHQAGVRLAFLLNKSL